MYKVSDIATISGVSKRTIRYYDEIALLKPSKISSNGYRFYTDKDLDRLQQILLYKNLGMSLYDISKILNDDNFDIEKSLKETLKSYKTQKNYIEDIIENIEKSLKDLKGEVEMSKEEKFDKVQDFEKYKETMLKENKAKYGEEMEQNPQIYDPEMVKYSQDKVKNMTKEEYETITNLGIELQKLLENHVNDETFDCNIAKEIYEKHKAWLVFYWGSYIPNAHRGVCDMYVYDERFKKYYDKNIDGCANFLRKCVYFATDTEI